MLVLVLQPLLTALLRSFRRGQRLLLKADGAARGSEALQVRSAAPLPLPTSARSPEEPRPHGGPERRAAAGERGHDVRGCGPGAAAAGRLAWGAQGVDWGPLGGRFGVSMGSNCFWGPYGVPWGSF